MVTHLKSKFCIKSRGKRAWSRKFLEGECGADFNRARAWRFVRRRRGSRALNWLSTTGHSRDAEHQQNNPTSQ